MIQIGDVLPKSTDQELAQAVESIRSFSEMLTVRQVNRSAFQTELRALINKHSMENGSDTPDFILAKYLLSSLDTLDTALRARHDFYNQD